MLNFKDGKTMEQAIDEVLRSYLIRCYATVSKQCPPIAGMNPEEGVGCLFKLRNEGKIRIELDSVGELVECKISYVN
jgi:hypothetical protein